MNWRRGLIRLWLAASILWIACIGIILFSVFDWSLTRNEPVPAVPAALDNCYTKTGPHALSDKEIECEMALPVRYETRVDYKAIGIIMALMFTVPALLLLLGYGARWVFIGFKSGLP